jgi:long-chain acyl-CoA synthetase
VTVYDTKPWLQSYDPWVAPELTIPDETYVDLLERAISYDPDRIVFHFLGSTYYYRDLDRFSGSFAGYLAGRGCVPGDVVGVNLPNTPQYLIALARHSACRLRGQRGFAALDAKGNGQSDQ